jgi:hypothetical protein
MVGGEQRVMRAVLPIERPNVAPRFDADHISLFQMIEIEADN